MSQWSTEWTWIKGHVTWLEDSKEHLSLTMVREEFNDIEQSNAWQSQGFNPRTGRLFDMRYENQPLLTQKLIAYAELEGLEHVGVSYYMMESGDNLPYHTDTYNKYISLFNLENRKKKIVRFIFFPEDRKPGHIFEIDGKIFDWKAGDWIAWKWDTPHMAANMGLAPRYSIQVTGVLREGF
jgi:hypothetical protein